MREDHEAIAAIVNRHIVAEPKSAPRLTAEQAIAKLPAKIKIGPFDYAFKTITANESHARGRWGECSSTLSEITLAVSHPNTLAARLAEGVLGVMVFINARDIAGFGLAALMLAVIAILGLRTAIRQSLCKHERYFETGACHAICMRCRKDLGFIGTVEKARREAKQNLA